MEVERREGCAEKEKNYSSLPNEGTPRECFETFLQYGVCACVCAISANLSPQLRDANKTNVWAKSTVK
jgi:hypothetical protein